MTEIDGREVFNRLSFEEYDAAKIAYVTYELVDELPDFSTFVYGTKHEIVLRNCETKRLERIVFTISGDTGKVLNYDSEFWGDIYTTDYNSPHACLVFVFNSKLELKSVRASFCGRSMDGETFNKITSKIRYAASFTKYDIFRPFNPD